MLKRKVKDKTEVKDNISCITVSRQTLINSDLRRIKGSGYIGDYKTCECYYNFLRQNYYADLRKMELKSIDTLYTDSILTDRNIHCLNCLIFAALRSDEKSYWHELSDFMENHGFSDRNVSTVEIQIFMAFFKEGEKRFLK